MKSLLICPAERPMVFHLAETQPLVNLSLCGKPFIYYWVEFLAALGAKHISILATDRPNLVRDMVGDGSRWGITLDVLPERRELTVPEARAKYCSQGDFLPGDYQVNLADHLPEIPDIKLFSSYAHFFEAGQKWLPHVATPDRIGLKEITPGIWVGLHSRIPASTKLTAPCWIGDYVMLGENVELGPGAIVESHNIVDSGATITNSVIQSETFIGPGTEITDSIVIKNSLINWKHNSTVQITDPFLLAPLQGIAERTTSTTHLGRLAALLVLIATAPLAFVWVVVSTLRAQTVLRKLEVVDPSSDDTEHTIPCFEFANCSGLWQRWPQLWNVVTGDFAWVGNRPLTAREAASLTSDYEKLWLKAPVGLVSQADAEGCFEKRSDEACAHASFYAVHRSFRGNLEILRKVIVGCGKRTVTAPIPMNTGVLETKPITLGKTASR